VTYPSTDVHEFADLWDGWLYERVIADVPLLRVQAAGHDLESSSSSSAAAAALRAAAPPPPPPMEDPSSPGNRRCIEGLRWPEAQRIPCDSRRGTSAIVLITAQRLYM
jgi:hypothetical protein